ncbi:hypothetical protein Poly59_04600 [Rubripirellula reticaptiva]|uniref:Uncharacterized protein n=2 Tax=Rubripirellula reticaptiva TaxID=2528013 RepID=A0A5C6F767_9BACT|nr:hypothetical protein Poly59_04600 [Rubripirellula reticaptiva]
MAAKNRALCKASRAHKRHNRNNRNNRFSYAGDNAFLSDKASELAQVCLTDVLGFFASLSQVGPVELPGGGFDAEGSVLPNQHPPHGILNSMAVSSSTTDQTASTEDKNIITLDRRGKDRRDAKAEAVDTGVIKSPRRKQQRRRHIDPTTCERDYSGQEIEFMKAMDDYKRDSGRMFPTCSEVLEVIRSLGYCQLTDDQADQLGLVADPAFEAQSSEESLDDDFDDEA